MNNEIDNKINLVPSSDDDRDWILDSYYVGYYKKNWINPKIEYELADRVILQGNYNYKENPSILNIEETINIIKEWFNFQYFHNKLNSITNLDLIKMENDNNGNNNCNNNFNNINGKINISARNILKKISKLNLEESIKSNSSNSSDMSNKTFSHSSYLSNSSNKKDKKLLNYCRIYSIETLKKSLIDNGIALIILPYYTKNFKTNFWISSNNSNNNNSNNNKFLGCMSLIVIGYNDEGFVIINNNKDEYFFPYSDWGIQCEIWTILHYTL